ncbi:MAG: hypothetical protein HYV60_05860 [Planctomycetia bacterium]|nr:hypothetical protein [Planctomycetia bacterium]
MPAKSQIPWLLVTLVLTAYTHCVFSHGLEAGDRHQQLRTDVPPLDNPRATCENESACICKGVTLTIGVAAPSPELNLFDLVCIESSAEWLTCVADSSDRRSWPDCGKTPSSGRNLRARLQRFLL